MFIRENNETRNTSSASTQPHHHVTTPLDVYLTYQHSNLSDFKQTVKTKLELHCLNRVSDFKWLRMLLRMFSPGDRSDTTLAVIRIRKL